MRYTKVWNLKLTLENTKRRVFFQQIANVRAISVWYFFLCLSKILARIVVIFESHKNAKSRL